MYGQSHSWPSHGLPDLQHSSMAFVKATYPVLRQGASALLPSGALQHVLSWQ